MGGKRKKTGPRKYPDELIYDEGRLIIRRLGTRLYMGFRVKTWQAIRGRQTGFIKSVHDLQEAKERRDAAGLVLGDPGREFSSQAALQKKREHHTMAANFLTSKTWSCGDARLEDITGHTKCYGTVNSPPSNVVAIPAFSIEAKSG